MLLTKPCVTSSLPAMPKRRSSRPISPSSDTSPLRVMKCLNTWKSDRIATKCCRYHARRAAVISVPSSQNVPLAGG
nr:hypothetical protein [Roseomonas aerilata]